MSNQDLKSLLAIRYSSALYLGYGKGSVYHFIYAYKRFFFEILKSVAFLISSLSLQSNVKSSSLALYVTKNQKKALMNGVDAGIIDGSVSHLKNVSCIANCVRLLIWLCKPLLYPLFFFQSKRKEHIYYTLCSRLMFIYADLLVRKLRNNGCKNIYISNDHAGDIFLLTIALRPYADIVVTYLQHGAVKPEFPDNYFDKIYVYDEKYIGIYEKLSKNKKAVIYVCEKLIIGQVIKDLGELDVLICFSHQFKIFNTIRLLILLRNMDVPSVGLRFHPSDRLSLIKAHFLSMFCTFSVSQVELGYEQDFSRSKYVFCASSSLLVDAYNSDFLKNVIWLKAIGLTWDYYGLEDRITTLNTIKEVAGIVDGH